MIQNTYREKIQFYKDIIDNIQITTQKYKLLKIININDYNNCIEEIEKLISLLNKIYEEINNHIDNDIILNNLNIINTELLNIIKKNGIYNFDLFLKLSLNSNFIQKNLNNDEYKDKFEIIKNYIHITNYKIINWSDNLMKKNNFKTNEISKNKIIDDKIILEETNMLECFDLTRIYNNFYIKIYGIKIIIHDFNNKKTFNINGIIDDILITNIKNKFISNKIENLNNYLEINNLKKNELYVNEVWINYINNLNIKDYLIYNDKELFNKYILMMTQINNFEQKTLNALVQEFIGSELYNQRKILIYLLMNNHKQKFLYISYLLYDILSNDNQSNIDTNEQKMLYDSLSWNCKKLFKEAMHKTIEYTTTLSNFDTNKIPLEQQICLMKVNDNVKEKAMQKLKEIKSKSEDSGSKARQYLDGLLKIPFGIYKEEFILNKKIEIKELFFLLKEPLKELNIINLKNEKIINFINNIKNLIDNDTDNFNSLKISNIIYIIDLNFKTNNNDIIYNLLDNIFKLKKKLLILIINNINNTIKENKLNIKKLNIKDNINNLKINIFEFFNLYKNDENIIKNVINLLLNISNDKIFHFFINSQKIINKIILKNLEVINYINSFNNILNNAVYGHTNAKKQIERIIGQWINGEKSGYCFGFEGPPGLGKTTLAKKGLANCLKDINGDSRPFAFIALGGSSNGSILEGHNYTYVGSTWGKIVDILIDKKCMNPIIFIDELDKVSKTEHGKEIIGILTHLIDTTQNDNFQDKYFSNIDLDLSKVLFIFSYNDPELIDKILLDRIHRIKFNNLLLDDKIIIVKDYLLPELYKKFGIDNIINIEEDLIIYIIENYTNEPGVRKLKEILFEIISTINLELLKKTDKYTIPFYLTKDIIQEILYEHIEIRYLKINNEPKIGVINGLWANVYGMSGILHIEAKFFFTTTFLDLKLTGMQGDVMKESMNVAKTLSLSLIEKNDIKEFLKNFEENKMQGIHIHIPEGATPKDGPSAGAAITILIYSLLMNKKIKNNYAITGEINLQGKITAIGSLELKILGGIKAGINTFLYPKDNSKDFKLLYEKHKNKLKNFNFFEVNNIKEAIEHIIL